MEGDILCIDRAQETQQRERRETSTEEKLSLAVEKLAVSDDSSGVVDGNKSGSGGSGDASNGSNVVNDQRAKLLSSLIEAMRNRAHDHLRNDRNGSGKRLYKDWELTKRKQQRLDCYDNEFFRDYYVLSKLPWSVGISVQAFDAVAAADAGCATVLLQWRSAVCIGCGPGSDAIALLSHSQSEQMTLFLVDRCPGWQRFLSELDEQARLLNLPASVWFKPAAISDSEKAVRTLPRTDIVVLSFAHSVNANADLWPLLASRYKLVLVIDIESEYLTAALQDANYQNCTIHSQSAVSVFYHLSNSSN